MTRDGKAGGHSAPNARDLLDAYFDGEIDRAGKGRLHEALREDPVLAEEFSRTSEAVSMLRQGASNNALEIDLTERVLAQTERYHGYLSKRGRRFVLAGRSAVAMAAMVIIAGIVVWIRLTPPEMRLTASERPLGTLLESGNADAASLRLVPPAVQRDLADSVDQSKAERRIVFDLPVGSPEDFSMFGRQPEGDTRAMARLPLLAKPSDLAEQRAMALRQGPLPMGEQQAASMVPAPDSMGWWARTPGDLLTRPEIVRTPNGVWLLVRPRAPQADQADRDPE